MNRSANTPVNTKRILIVEDERKIAEVLRDYLLSENYTVEIVMDGALVLASVRTQMPDLILLDWMLPNKNGANVCKEIREFSTVPVIMLTARVEEIDRLLGLDLGADDYICKPFSPREVLARVRALLRRTEWIAQQERPFLESGTGSAPRLYVDHARYQAYFNGQSLGLTPVEFRLLATLLAQPGRVYSRGQLQSQCYLDHRIVSDRTVDSHIKNIRKKFEDVEADADPLCSVYGVGYKLELR